MMIKAIIFDMDGVMIDGESANFAAMNRTLKEFALQISYEEYKQTIGLNSFDTWSLLRKKMGLKSDLDYLMDRFSKNLDLEYPNAAPVPGFLKFFKMAAGKNFKIAVASSTQLKEIKGVLSRLGIIRRFDVIASAEECDHGKPYPDVYILAMKRLGVNPKYCIAIEDSRNGMLAAKAAGIFTIVIPTEHTKHQVFSEANLILKSLNEFTEERLINILP